MNNIHRRKNSFHLKNFSHQTNTLYAALPQSNSRIKTPKQTPILSFPSRVSTLPKETFLRFYEV